MDFYKNDLIDTILERNFKTWEHTLDTGDFVSPKYAQKIDNYIFKNLKVQFAEVDVYYLLHLKYQGIKLGLFERLKIWLSGIECKYQVLHPEEVKKFDLINCRKNKLSKRNKKFNIKGR